MSKIEGLPAERYRPRRKSWSRTRSIPDGLTGRQAGGSCSSCWPSSWRSSWSRSRSSRFAGRAEDCRGVPCRGQPDGLDPYHLGTGRRRADTVVRQALQHHRQEERHDVQPAGGGAGLLIDALTTSWPLFLVGRGLAGFAYPAIIISYGLIRDLVPRKWVSTAVSFVAGGSGLTAVLGPVVGGLLSDHYSWRSFFWFMFMLFRRRDGAVLRAAGAGDQAADPTAARPDRRGDPGCGVALSLFYLNEGQSWGWGRPATLGWLLGGLALLIVLPFWERTRSAPLVDLGLVRARRVWTVLLVGGMAPPSP